MKTPLKMTLVIMSMLLVLNVFSVAFIQVGSSAVSIPDYEPLDMGPQIREASYPIGPNVEPEECINDPVPYYNVGDIAWWLAADFYSGYYFWSGYQLKAIGTVAEVWVQVNLSWPTGDPRAYPTILPAQISYLLNEFENHMYPILTGYFGQPDLHDGAYQHLYSASRGVGPGYWYEPTGRNVILVSNIRDENYYDYTYPYYIAGFYSSSYEYYFDRNVISIDSWRWERRLGPAGTEWIPGVYVDRPFLYETVVAHEYQHLIHDDYNPDDPSFMNEGCSMFAEILTYQSIPWSDINSYLYTPDNSLTEWGDQGDINILADYGAAALWAIYLKDHFGPPFLRDFLRAGIPGIAGLNAALAPFGQTFESVYHDWRIANLIHTDTPGAGRYNYVTIDLGSPEAIPARTYELKKPLYSWRKGTAFGNTITILGYDTGVSLLGSYGSDYIKFTGLREDLAPVLNFDGDDTAGVGWTTVDKDGDGDKEWYSTKATDLADISIIATVNLAGMTTATLTFDTWVNTEPLWDFGFVQVSTDGLVWTSLPATHTTYNHDPSAHPDIVANLPGYTGDSGGWLIGESADLTPYVGGTVMLRFRYMTDWATLYPGWWVDNIAINGVTIDNADTIIAFAAFPPAPEVDWMVTLIGVEVTRTQAIRYTKVEDVTLDDLTEKGIADLTLYIEHKGYVLLIISPNQGPADYMFSVTKE